MGIVSVILGIVLATLGAYLLFSSLKRAKTIDRDRFNKTNSAGLVEHSSYDDAHKFARNEFANTMKLMAGGILLLLGIAAIIAGPRNEAAQNAREQQSLDRQSRKLERECEAIITGPPGGDLTPCHDLCQIEGYQQWCEQTFGLPEGPPRGSRGGETQ